MAPSDIDGDWLLNVVFKVLAFCLVLLMQIVLSNYADAQDNLSIAVSSSEPRPALSKLFGRAEGWTGADGAYSIQLNDKQTLWLFGDTWIGKVKDGRRVDPTMINNSVAVQDLQKPDEDLSFYWDESHSKAQSIFKATDSTTWFWPGDGKVLDGKMYVVMHLIRSKPADASSWAFEGIGDQLAQIENPFDKPAEWHTRYKSLPTGLAWGNAVICSDGFLYVFGEYPPAAEGFYKHPIVLARIANDKVNKLQFDGWQYWCKSKNSGGTNSGQWQSKLESPIVLMQDGASEMSVSQVRGMSGYFATYIRAGLGQDIAVRRAARLEGPWTEAQTVYHCENTAKNVFLYSAKAHPELATRDGEMVITYCRNTESLEENVEHAEIYRPQGVTVMLTLPK